MSEKRKMLARATSDSHAVRTAVSAAIVHFEKARQLGQEEKLASAAFEPLIRDLYTQLGQVYELSDQQEQALDVHNELAQLTPKES